MDLELNDKIAIVTGSSKGLGFASAKALVEEGCRVTICARNAGRLAEAENELRAASGRNNSVLAMQVDVSTASGISTGASIMANRPTDPDSRLWNDTEAPEPIP